MRAEESAGQSGEGSAERAKSAESNAGRWQDGGRGLLCESARYHGMLERAGVVPSEARVSVVGYRELGASLLECAFR